MRKTGETIASIRDTIAQLKGHAVDMRVDYGRKRIVDRTGVIDNVYPSVFTVVSEVGDISSFSYTDILCGQVRVCKKES